MRQQCFGSAIFLMIIFSSCKGASYHFVEAGGPSEIGSSDDDTSGSRGNDDSSPGENSTTVGESTQGKSILQATQLEAGDDDACPQGGVKLETGIDADGDGQLSNSEINQTTYVCNGADGKDGTDSTDGADGKDGTDGADGKDGVTETITQEIVKIRERLVAKDPNGPIEILIAMDTSSSMTTEKDRLQENMPLFLTNLANEKINARVTAIGDQFQFPIIPNQTFFRHYETHVDSHDAIGVLNRYFQAGNHGLNSDAVLEVFIFTDDNGIGAGNLATDFMPPTMKKVKVSGIIGKAKGQSQTNDKCHIANVGSVYEELANKTGGMTFDLCQLTENQQSWKELIDKLTLNVKNEAFTYDLLTAPDIGASISVSINGQNIPSYAEGTREGYIINNETLRFSSGIIIEQGDDIVISYSPVK